ncbi:MAG: hypothetical protein A3I68_07930 [Candidatus Melainabacteria bacterium RIFCSPLOWO2_02_FULL_35_15]|nr:MAG: hypothetical protein A3F80_02600 [Candidatus Melainabacteria bacterium RIFCSPLOWO2_12_FULL_35_11]OGI14249.1 MAG: hypothetical protein A3I68_07930 [Candidatus Melainabacteria bacterium RIFCSPLOWO2_02_FULL_35_15]
MWLTNFRNIDVFFLQLTFTLIITGIIFAFSSSVYESYRLTNSFWTMGLKQLAALVIGLAAMVLFSKVNYKFWFKSTTAISVIMLLVMIITVFSGMGKASGGSQRWIDIGGFQFQPAEIAKFSVILLLSNFLTLYKWTEFKKYFPYIILITLLIFIILKQPDLGSASILVLVILEMLFVFGYPVWILFLVVPLTGLAGYLKLKSIPYQAERITYWINPYLDPQGKGYNLIQSRYAFGFGSLFGAGLGNSVQKNGHLPIPHSDFIFAVIGEETGYLGVTAILILYLSWILRGIFLINKVQNKYGRILGTAIIFLISTQAVINISVTAGLMPVTGVTLPLFSCGGTSLIVTLAMIGIFFNILSLEKEAELKT